MKALRLQTKKRVGTPTDPFSSNPIGERTVRSPMGCVFFGTRGVPRFLPFPLQGLGPGPGTQGPETKARARSASPGRGSQWIGPGGLGLAIGTAMGHRLRHAPMSVPSAPARRPLPWEPGSGPGPGAQAQGPEPKGPKPEGPHRAGVTRFLSARYV